MSSRRSANSPAPATASSPAGGSGSRKRSSGASGGGGAIAASPAASASAGKRAGGATSTGIGAGGGAGGGNGGGGSLPSGRRAAAARAAAAISEAASPDAEPLLLHELPPVSPSSLDFGSSALLPASPLAAAAGPPAAATGPVKALPSSAALAAPSAVQAGLPGVRRKQPVPNRIIPAFLNKLYIMVGDPSSDEFIHWTPEGTSFVVTNQELFSQHVLPQYFKHSNFTSFIRQLNMYGFHKIPSIQHGSLVAESQVEQFEFAHDNFQRGKQDLLCFVIRRRAVHNEELVKEGSLDINSVLHEITAIKRHQMTISSDLQKMQRDNETIWSETVQLRERAAKQQDTIDKILRFLASIFSSSTKAPTLSAASKRRRIELPASLPVGSSGSEASFDANSGHANLNGVLPVQLPTPTPTSSALGQHSLHGISTPQQLQELHDQSQLPLSLASSSKQSQAQGLQAQHLLAGSTAASVADLLAGPIFDLSAGSASSNPNPQLLDQLASSTNNIRASIQSAHEVAEDIDILQDRVNDIAAAVTSLAHQPDALHQWNVDDLIANAGDDDDHAALLALMSQQPELLKLAGNPTAAAAALAAGVPSAKPESAPNMLSSLPATVPISMPMTVHIPVSVPVTVPMPIAGGIALSGAALNGTGVNGATLNGTTLPAGLAASPTQPLTHLPAKLNQLQHPLSTEAQQTAMTNGHSHDSEAIDDDYFDTFFSTS